MSVGADLPLNRHTGQPNRPTDQSEKKKRVRDDSSISPAGRLHGIPSLWRRRWRWRRQREERFDCPCSCIPFPICVPYIQSRQQPHVPREAWYDCTRESTTRKSIFLVFFKKNNSNAVFQKMGKSSTEMGLLKAGDLSSLMRFVSERECI